jgi:hypothetical protein
MMMMKPAQSYTKAAACKRMPQAKRQAKKSPLQAAG